MEPGALTTVFEILGALLILGAYGALQLRRLGPSSALFLLANAAGSGILTVIAALSSSWGFLLLNAVWMSISLVALVRRSTALSMLGRRSPGVQDRERERSQP
jgi:hypothetical protein